jgi:hypothetical protein
LESDLNSGGPMHDVTENSYGKDDKVMELQNLPVILRNVDI